jgi:hypothetical protein
MQEGTFMRTTLDLPDDILRRAKIAAVERGSSLRQLVTDALRREIEGSRAQRSPPNDQPANQAFRRRSVT